MINPLTHSANNLSIKQNKEDTRPFTAHEQGKSDYLMNKAGGATNNIASTSSSDTVEISEDAATLFQAEKDQKTSKSTESGEHATDMLDKLIEETKERIVKLQEELDKIVGDSESAEIQREALQTQLLALHNQLLILVSKKAEILAKAAKE